MNTYRLACRDSEITWVGWLIQNFGDKQNDVNNLKTDLSNSRMAGIFLQAKLTRASSASATRAPIFSLCCIWDILIFIFPISGIFWRIDWDKLFRTSAESTRNWTRFWRSVISVLLTKGWEINCFTLRTPFFGLARTVSADDVMNVLLLRDETKPEAWNSHWIILRQLWALFWPNQDVNWQKYQNQVEQIVTYLSAPFSNWDFRPISNIVLLLKCNDWSFLLDLLILLRKFFLFRLEKEFQINSISPEKSI